MLFETSLNSPMGELGLLADDTYLIELSLKGLKKLSLRGAENIPADLITKLRACPHCNVSLIQ